MSDKQCPTVTRPTLYGAVTLVCSGHGTCDTSSGNCTCSDGSHWASWQISPENLQPGAGGDDRRQVRGETAQRIAGVERSDAIAERVGDGALPNAPRIRRNPPVARDAEIPKAHLPC